MAGGKKKKSSSSKKNKSSRSNNGAANNKKKPIPLEEVLSQAESAMEMSDVDTALRLFSYASGVLRSRVHSTSINGAGGGNNNSSNTGGDQDKVTLSTVLGKMGELKASNGDIEGARSDFLDAIELLGTTPTTTSTELDDKNMALDDGGSNVHMAQSSESRAGLHLYLGQLSSGPEALASFRVGVSELERAVNILERICAGAAGGGGSNDIDMGGCDDDMGSAENLKRFLVETKRQLCAAHCSIAELYLTDLCEEPDAESLCEAALNSALKIDEESSKDFSVENSVRHDEDKGVGPPPPDALQTMANFRLSQSRVPEALECILKAYDRMKVGCEAMSALVGLGKDGKEEVDMEAKSRELVEVDAASSLPEYNFRCQTAKIMLECASLLENNSEGSGATNSDATIIQCAESAIQVLGSLLAENDEVIEVWYLLGCAFMACKPPSPESAHYYWETALGMLTKVKESLEEAIDNGDDDDDGCNENELEAIECQIIEVKKKLGKDEGDEDMEDS